MRFSAITVFTLTVLCAGGLSAQASDSPISQAGTEPPLPQNETTTPTVPQQAKKAICLQPCFAIAAPENLEEQPFLQKAAKDSRQKSAQINQNTQNLAGEQGQGLAEIPKQPDHLVPFAIARDQEVGGVLSKAEALRPNEVIAQSSTNTTPLVAASTCATKKAQNPESAYQLVAQAQLERCPRPEAVPQIVVPQPVPEFEASPALSIYIPVGYGADRNTVFLSGSYQSSVRKDRGDVGAAGIGIGLGDAAKTVGVELSYALETSENFGEGGFNAKIHRRLGQDLAGAIGWNGFLNFGRNDFEQSKYGVLTKVFRTQESLNSAFSRVSVTAGVGDGQFRSNGAVKAGDNNVNVFGNVAVRVIRPVSLIAEWTGQDLALGLSIAPFKNVPFVITPAVRDIAGAGNGARFVLGAGTAFRF